MNTVSPKDIRDFSLYLNQCEKAKATVEKYIRDLRAFSSWLGNQPLSKNICLEYKKHLSENFLPASVNSIISSLNSFFDFSGNCNCRLKSLKIQRKIFLSKDKELTKNEYNRLLKAAENKPRLSLVLQTICACGIRVSEDI